MCSCSFHSTDDLRIRVRWRTGPVKILLMIRLRLQLVLLKSFWIFTRVCVCLHPDAFVTGSLVVCSVHTGDDTVKLQLSVWTELTESPGRAVRQSSCVPQTGSGCAGHVFREDRKWHQPLVCQKLPEQCLHQRLRDSQQQQAAHGGEGSVRDGADVVQGEGQSLQLRQRAQSHDRNLRQDVILQPQVTQRRQAFKAGGRQAGDGVGVQTSADRMIQFIFYKVKLTTSLLTSSKVGRDQAYKTSFINVMDKHCL